MGYEAYLIEIKPQIIAINKISPNIKNLILDNYSNKDKNHTYIKEIFALNTVIQMITYYMRIRRKQFYRKIESSYVNDFSYDSIIFENI